MHSRPSGFRRPQDKAKRASCLGAVGAGAAAGAPQPPSPLPPAPAAPLLSASCVALKWDAPVTDTTREAAAGCLWALARSEAACAPMSARLAAARLAALVVAAGEAAAGGGGAAGEDARASGAAVRHDRGLLGGPCHQRALRLCDRSSPSSTRATKNPCVDHNLLTACPPPNMRAGKKPKKKGLALEPGQEALLAAAVGCLKLMAVASNADLYRCAPTCGRRPVTRRLTTRAGPHAPMT